VGAVSRFGVSSSVAVALVDTAVVGANDQRNGISFFNESNQVCYLKFASGDADTVSYSSYTTQLAPNGFFMPPHISYKGYVRAIWGAVGASVSTVLGSTTQATGSGNSAAIASPPGNNLDLTVNVTAQTGTPSNVITIQWSDDGTNWAGAQPGADAFPALTAVGLYTEQFTIKAAYYRFSYTVSGAASSSTFTIAQYTPPATGPDTAAPAGFLRVTEYI